MHNAHTHTLLYQLVHAQCTHTHTTHSCTNTQCTQLHKCTQMHTVAQTHTVAQMHTNAQIQIMHTMAHNALLSTHKQCNHCNWLRKLPREFPFVFFFCFFFVFVFYGCMTLTHPNGPRLATSPASEGSLEGGKTEFFTIFTFLAQIRFFSAGWVCINVSPTDFGHFKDPPC